MHTRCSYLLPIVCGLGRGFELLVASSKSANSFNTLGIGRRRKVITPPYSSYINRVDSMEEGNHVESIRLIQLQEVKK